MKKHTDIYSEVEWLISQRATEPAERKVNKMTRADITVETYETGRDDYMVDIVRSYSAEDGATAYEAWIYRREGAIKTHIFGLDDVDYAEFRAYVEDMIEKTDDFSVIMADGS